MTVLSKFVEGGSMKNGWNSLRKKSRKNWKVLFWKVHRLLKYRLQPGRGLMN